jgi:hypothetical protein
MCIANPLRYQLYNIYSKGHNILWLHPNARWRRSKQTLEEKKTVFFANGLCANPHEMAPQASIQRLSRRYEDRRRARDT